LVGVFVRRGAGWGPENYIKSFSKVPTRRQCISLGFGGKRGAPAVHFIVQLSLRLRVSGGIGRCSHGCSSDIWSYRRSGGSIWVFDVALSVMMIKWKAGRGGALCACASLPLPTSSSITPMVMCSGQVARSDGRRFGPSERGAADHWWSYRPFLRHRLDDRLCPSTTSCAAPARKHTLCL